MSRAPAVLPSARPPFPGDWVPEMAERGLSLFTVRVLWSHRSYDFTVQSVESTQPEERVPWLGVHCEGGQQPGPFDVLTQTVIKRTMPEAIETALANVHWWIQHEGWAQ